MKQRQSSRPAQAPGKQSADPPGLAVRRIAADIVDGVLRRRRPLDEQLEGSERPSRSCRPAGSRPRADPRAGRGRAAAARQLASSPRPVAGARPAEGCAAGRDGAVDRGCANPFSRCARSCGGRSRGAAGAGRSQRHALYGPRQCRAAPAHARRRRASGGARCGRARHAAMADATLDRRLRRAHGARHRGRQCQRAGARRHGERAIRRCGPSALADGSYRPARCA